MLKILNTKLQNNHNYINSGNLFSKCMLLQNSLDYQDNNTFFIVDNEKKKEEYKKILDYLSIKYIEVNNISPLIDLIYNKNTDYIYIIEKSFFESEIVDLRNLENKLSVHIKKGETLKTELLLEKLNDFGYKFGDYLDPGMYKKTGDLISIRTYFSDITYKISLWGDLVENIIKVDNKNTEEVKSVSLGKIERIILEENKRDFNSLLLEKFNEKNIRFILDDLDFYINFENFDTITNKVILNSLKSESINQIDIEINDIYIEKIDQLTVLLNETEIDKKIIFTRNKIAISNFIEYNNINNIEIYETKLNNLKSFRTDKILVLCDDNIGRVFVKKRIKRSLSQNMDLLLQIKPGDCIVHIDHGIGIFNQILEKDLSGIKKEYIELQYNNNDKLFVPISEIYRVSKYVGIDNPKLTGLNTKEWEKKITKASEDIEIVAQELLEIYAKRKLQEGFAFKRYEDKEKSFSQAFSYVYTDDQVKVIDEISKDMESKITMDRLLSGDVGFGKTEIAFNAIYKAAINGKQAALISPLVVLAYEHYDKALDRFRDFGIKVEVLTRFEKSSVIKNTLAKLKDGSIDLIIGTHRLLSEDVQYKDLGLLVVDEEHKFGVKDKEKIKNLKGNIDILSMSATPIPRSLNMALSGIRSMSMLTTPPFGRKNIQTYVSRFDDNIILQAGKKEFERGGQLFFIHNRVSTIDSMKKYLEQIFPHKSVIITHGQLPGDQLEKRIIQFKRKEYDILLSTTVIENGIDFSNVNTIIINDAYNFGISQIHQLRGRVGRNDKQGYCYLLYRKDKIKEDAAKRLKTMVDYSHLGAGFELAIKDLEVRGGGDILGVNQSGQSKDIGINLFLEMLENKVEELKNKIDSSVNSKGETSVPVPKKINTTIDLNVSAYIPDIFFSSELDKINFYREIESLNNIEDLENIIEDFRIMNPDFPQETQNFFNLLKLKIKAHSYRIKSIKKIGINYQIDFKESIKIEDLKNFLVLDTEVNFTVISGTRLRTEVKRFKSDLYFIEYMLNLNNERKPGEKKRFKIKRVV